MPSSVRRRALKALWVRLAVGVRKVITGTDREPIGVQPPDGGASRGVGSPVHQPGAPAQLRYYCPDTAAAICSYGRFEVHSRARNSQASDPTEGEGAEPPRSGDGPIVVARIPVLPTRWITVAAVVVWLVSGAYMFHFGASWHLDLRVYRAAGHALYHGGSPFTTWFTANQLPFTYTPFALLVLSPLAFGRLGLVESGWWLLERGVPHRHRGPGPGGVHDRSRPPGVGGGRADCPGSPRWHSSRCAATSTTARSISS